MSPRTAITGVRLFDGLDFHPPSDVLIGPDGSVAGIRPAGSGGHDRDGDVTTVDGAGRCLLPGLVDCHVHCTAGQPRETVRFGVTTLLDLHNDPDFVRRQAGAAQPAARVHTAGWGFAVRGAHPYDDGGGPVQALTPGRPVDAREARELVRHGRDQGSAFVKVFLGTGAVTGHRWPSPDAETVRALVGAAHDAGMPAVAHTLDAGSARLAVDAGVDVLGHAWVDEPVDPRLAGEMARRGTAVVPTLCTLRRLCGAPDDWSCPDLAALLDALARATLDAPAGCPAGSGPDGFRTASDTVGRLHRAGVRILAGTDAPNPGTAAGYSLHHEMALLAAAGVDACTVLRGATGWAADVFGLRDAGRVRVGSVADLLLVDGDPATDVRAATRIVEVWRAGTPVARVPRDPVVAGTRTAPADVPDVPDVPTVDGPVDWPGIARWTAAELDAEHRRGTPLVRDPEAASSAGETGRRWRATLGADGMAAESPLVAVRTRFVDDEVRDWVDGGGDRQVVTVLGGFGGRFRRLGLPSTVPHFALDVPEVVAERAAGDRSVPVRPDAPREWAAALAAHGWDRRRPTLWVLDGVLCHLDETAVRDVVATALADGAPSRMVCDVLGQSLVHSPWLAGYTSTLRRLGAPLRWCSDDPCALFDGDTHVRLTQFGVFAEPFGRWPFPVPPLGASGFPDAYLVVADRGR